MKIFKYELSGTADTDLMLPAGARFLSLELQKGRPHIWCAVDPFAAPQPVKVRAVVTGGDVRDTERHLGTLLFNGGEFVLHYFATGL